MYNPQMDTTNREMMLQPNMAPQQPAQFMGNPLPGNYYKIRLPWGCKECCEYVCQGRCQYTVFQCSDSTFCDPTPIGVIDQTQLVLPNIRDPFVAHLKIGGQELVISRRSFKCCAPLCNDDETVLTSPSNQPLGVCVAKGLCWIDIDVIAPGGQLVYQIRRTCSCSCGWTFDVLDNIGNKVGHIIYEACNCCEYVIDLEMPAVADPFQRIQLLMATHFLENICREMQQQNQANGA